MLKDAVQLLTSYSSTIDEDFALFSKFLDGFQGQTIAPDIFTCTDKLQQTSDQYNQTTISNRENNVTDVQAIIFSYTAIISSSTADAVGDCYLAAYQTYQYVYQKATSFQSSSLFLEAFLQNLLGNAIRFNNLYNQILSAQQSNNQMQVYYLMGELMRLILIFDPISLSTPHAASLPDTSALFEQIHALNELMFKKSQRPFSSVEKEIQISMSAGEAAKVEGGVSTWDKVKGFFLVFFNESIGLNAPNSSICTGNVTVIENSIKLIQT